MVCQRLPLGRLLPLLLTLSAAAQRAPDGRSSEAHYKIAARLLDVPEDASMRRLTGELTLTFVNHSEDSLAELWFHLHHNAYSNNKTVHLEESGGKLRDVPIERGWGYQEVKQMRAMGTDLLPTLAFQQPDEAQGSHPHDRTVFKVSLPQPVPAGGTIEVDLQWESLIPRVRRRTGHHEDFLLMAHWFPKLGVYEEGKGWNCHQFHRDTEFYADYGTYDVTLDLPSKYYARDEQGKGMLKVAASGVQEGGVLEDGGRIKVRFLAPGREDQARKDEFATGARIPYPRVHGFAWSADPDYLVKEWEFNFASWREGHPAKSPYSYEVDIRDVVNASPRWSAAEEVSLRPVLVRTFIQPEHADQAERHANATMAALFQYGLWWGEYPYQEISVIDPAWGASAAGGMEYPTLFTSGTSMFTDPRMHEPESVTVHECGHQFWYGLVGNNEYEAAWLDEGFNSYTDSEVLMREYGPSHRVTRYAGLPVFGRRPGSLPEGGHFGGILTARSWRIPGRSKRLSPLGSSDFLDFWRDQPFLTFAPEISDPIAGDRSGYLADPETDPIETCGFCYCDRSSYRTNSYPRTAAALRALRDMVGETAFLRGMQHYSETWRYRHPYPEDFYAAFQEGSGQEVQWFFESVFRSTESGDWSVAVRQEKIAKKKGLFRTEEGLWKSAEDLGEAPSEDEGLQQYDVVVRRAGDLSLPIRIRVEYDGAEGVEGRVETFEWSREDQLVADWWRLPLPPGKASLKSVVIEPKPIVHLDRNLSNNRWYAHTEHLAPWRWTERSVTWHSRVLQWLSRIAG